MVFNFLWYVWDVRKRLFGFLSIYGSWYYKNCCKEVNGFFWMWVGWLWGRIIKGLYSGYLCGGFYLEIVGCVCIVLILLGNILLREVFFNILVYIFFLFVLLGSIFYVLSMWNIYCILCLMVDFYFNLFSLKYKKKSWLRKII